MTRHEQHMAAVRAVQRRTQLDRLRTHGRLWGRIFPDEMRMIEDLIAGVEEEMRADGQEP